MKVSAKVCATPMTLTTDSVAVHSYDFWSARLMSKSGPMPMFTVASSVVLLNVGPLWSHATVHHW